MRVKWTDLIFKNYEVTIEKLKGEEEDENEQANEICIYDEKNLLNFILTIAAHADKSIRGAIDSVL